MNPTATIDRFRCVVRANAIFEPFENQDVAGMYADDTDARMQVRTGSEIGRRGQDAISHHPRSMKNNSVKKCVCNPCHLHNAAMARSPDARMNAVCTDEPVPNLSRIGPQIIARSQTGNSRTSTHWTAVSTRYMRAAGGPWLSARHSQNRIAARVCVAHLSRKQRVGGSRTQICHSISETYERPLTACRRACDNITGRI